MQEKCFLWGPFGCKGTTKIAHTQIFCSFCVRPAGRDCTFGVDTHPKIILGRGVPNIRQKLHIHKFFFYF